MAANFSNSTPTAPAGYTNGTWQFDLSGNISVYVPSSILTNQNTSLVSLLPGDVLVWNGSEWINSSFPVPAGSPGDIQYNDGGILGGSSATVDAIGNIVAKTLTLPSNTSLALTVGNLASLPSFVGFGQASYGALNYLSGIIPTGGISPTTGVGAMMNLATYCTDASTASVGMNVNILGSGITVAHAFEAIAASGSSGANVIGVDGYTVIEDGTVSNADLRPFVADVPSSPTGATVALAAGLYAIINPGAGAALAYGVDIHSITSDSSSGTSVGLYIANEISGATTYAIQSLSTAPSTFAGSITLPNLILSAPQTPASNAVGTTGQIAYGTVAGTSYIYVCIASGNWRRTALTAGY